MKTTKHTPGPWSTEYDGSIVMNRQIVSGPIAPESADREERDANAALIAAAPDLLAFARECARADSDCGESIREAARAAIARAEGGAK